LWCPYEFLYHMQIFYIKRNGANVAPAQQFRVFSMLLLMEKTPLRTLGTLRPLGTQQDLIFYSLFTFVYGF
jgi:hypothetical protein